MPHIAALPVRQETVDAHCGVHGRVVHGESSAGASALAVLS